MNVWELGFRFGRALFCRAYRHAELKAVTTLEQNQIQKKNRTTNTYQFNVISIYRLRKRKKTTRQTRPSAKTLCKFKIANQWQSSSVRGKEGILIYVWDINAPHCVNEKKRGSFICLNFLNHLERSTEYFPFSLCKQQECSSIGWIFYFMICIVTSGMYLYIQRLWRARKKRDEAKWREYVRQIEAWRT